MIDVNYLNNQPKELSKETNTLKYLFNVLNEIKQELLYIKSNSECEFKNFDAPTKNLFNSLKNYNNELSNLVNDDYSNSLKTFDYFINVFTRSKRNNSASPREMENKIESPILNSTIVNILNPKETSIKNLMQKISNEGENPLPNEKEKEAELIDLNPNSNIISVSNNQKNNNSSQSSPEKQQSISNIPYFAENNSNLVNPQNNSLHAASMNSISVASNGSPPQTVNIDELSSFNLITKIFNEINNQINESLKGSQDSISSSLKDLLNQRNKFKALNQKADKQMKEIEYAIAQRKKLDTDDKNAYNLSVKEKSEDKILNLLNEYDDFKAQLTITFEDAKKSETNLNEIIKANFLFNLIITIQGIKKLKMSFDEMIDNKIRYLKTIEAVILQATEAIDKLELVANYSMDQKAFFEMKAIPYTNLEAINLEEAFQKNALMNVNLQNIEAILAYAQGVNLMIATRKKALLFIQKTSNEILKNIDSLVYNSSKSIKNLVTPKSNLINSCAFIKQIREFLKSSFDLIIKKYEELNKYMTSNLLNGLDSQLKELATDENFYSQFLNKFQKELNSYKANHPKLLQNKEKTTQNIDKVKEQVIKSGDDQTVFQKLEKQLMPAMAEDDAAKEALADLNKKFKKFCEENFEALKKNTEAYKDKEALKSKEIKEQILSIIKHKNKLINHIFEFLNFKSQIQVDAETCIFSIEKIYSNFFKETGVEAFEEKEFLELVKFLYSKNELEDLSLKKLISSEEIIPNLNLTITSLIKKINFLNKDELINLRKESEILSSGVSGSNVNANNNTVINNPENSQNQVNLREDDLKVYYEKLNFLKTNSKKISVRNMFEPNRKRYDDVFYYDTDEVVSPNNFSCALSDKILLQGKLFITNKKLVFYSWFNNASLFGTTLIEIPKSDIIEVKKQYNMIFDNSVEVQTKNVNFFFTSFVYRDKCYALIRENIFGEIEEPRKSILSIAPNLIPNLNPDATAQKMDVELVNIGNVNNSDDENVPKQPNMDIVAKVTGDTNLTSFEDNAINADNRLLTENLVPQTSEGITDSKKDEIAFKVKESNKIKITAPRDALEETKSNALAPNNQTKNNDVISNNQNINLLEQKEINILATNNLEVKDNAEKEDAAVKINKRLFDSELKEKLNALQEKNYEAFLAKNKREYNTVCLKNKDLGDVPLPYLFNSLFNPDKTCAELNLNKSFMRSLMEIRKDYDINYTKPPEENWDSQTPQFYKESSSNTTPYTNLFNTSPEKFRKIFLDDFSNSTFNFDSSSSSTAASPSEIDKRNMLSYKYTLVHPILKKRFMGPSKLNVEDVYKISFVSPKCFIVENFSYMSGFMMMDCFFSVMQYKFESEYDFVSENPKGLLDSIHNKTKLTISFGIEFVKTTMFKQKILDNGIEDTHEFVKTCLFPNIEKVVQGQTQRFLEEKKALAAQAKLAAAAAAAAQRAPIKPKPANIIDKLQESHIGAEESKLKEEVKILQQQLENENVEIEKGKKEVEEFKAKESILISTAVQSTEQEDSFIKMFLRENIFYVCFVICVCLLVGGKLEIINTSTILVILNMFGFAVVFDKLHAIERKMKGN